MLDRLVCIVLPVFRPHDAHFHDQIASIAAQEGVQIRVFFVVSDRESAPLIAQMAQKFDLQDHEVLIPAQNLSSVDAFEYGLQHLVDRADTLPPFIIALSDQDDVWLPSKLHELADMLDQSGADLVHSDTSIVDHDNQMLKPSMFQLERRDRATSPRRLLYRNNVTGMTCALTRGLAEQALPFPRQAALLFHHDLWLALVATVGKGIAFVDKPLVRYRQHGQNAVGAIMSRDVAPYAGWRLWLLERINSYYLANYLAKVLYRRCMQMNAVGYPIHHKRLRQLKPHLSIYGMGWTFLADSLRLLLIGKRQHASLAFGFFLARLARLGWALRMAIGADYTHRIAEFDTRRFAVIPGVQPGHGPAPLGGPNLKAWEDYVDRRKVPGWKVGFDAAEPPATVVLIPTLNPTEMFAGIATAVDFGIGLAVAGHRVKFISTDLPIASPISSLAFIKSRLPPLSPTGSHIEDLISVHCGVTSKHILHHRADVFFATAWWTAHVADRLIRQNDFVLQKFIYLIQDFEPNFYPWGDDYAGAMASYDLAFYPIFNTSLLQTYFASTGIIKADTAAVAFYPSIDLEHYTDLARKPQSRGAGQSVDQPANQSVGPRRRLAVYGRPEVARNMFPACVEALARFVQDCDLQPDEIEFVSVGMAHPAVTLPGGHQLVSLGKVLWADYAQFLSEVDIGLALMYSPHPSHLPLEMAAAGVRVVTNQFANKDLSDLSPLIISTHAEPGEIALGLRQAWQNLADGPPSDADRRVALDKLGVPLAAAIATVSKQITGWQPVAKDMAHDA